MLLRIYDAKNLKYYFRKFMLVLRVLKQLVMTAYQSTFYWMTANVISLSQTARQLTLSSLKVPMSALQFYSGNCTR
jgi:hypothetical protein